MKNKKQVLTVLGASIFGGVIALGAFQLFFHPSSNTYLQNSEPVNYRLAKNEVVPGNLDFTYAAEVSTPAVVHITTYQKVTQRSGYSQNQQMDDFFRQFFGDQYGQPKQPQQPTDPSAKEQKAGSGSGVVLTGDGYIVTNNHVINGADKIEVVLNDKRRYQAELIGVDPTTDLAVLKIEESDLPYLKYGDSDALKIGEWVVAVGNPFDLTSTVTAGIVSAKARNINILRSKENLAIESFIQTDAAVNPGNSGGALVDLNGHLVGINTAIATPTGTFAGYSFAVPATIVHKVVDDLIKFGAVQRALLGISIADVTADLVEEKGLGVIKGVYVAGVRENSSAAAAGLETGDVITKIGDHAVNSSSELQEAVSLYRPGDEVLISYLRNGVLKTSKATLQNKMGTTEVVKKSDPTMSTVFNSQVRELTPDELKEYGVSSGVKVVSIGEGKLKEAGVKSGFVITKVDKQVVDNIDFVISYLQGREGAILIEGLYTKNQRAYYAIGY